MKTFEEALGHIPGDIEAGLQPSERAFMFQRIRDHCSLRQKPFKFLEIGTGPGTGTMTMAEAWPDAEIHTYDLYANCYDDVSRPCGYVMGDRSRYPNVHFYTGAFRPTNERYQIIFIDADHIHPAPFLDCLLAMQCASTPDCLIFLHDADINGHYVCPYGHGAEYLWAAVKVNPYIRHIDQCDMMGCVLFGTDSIYEICRCLLLDVKPDPMPLLASGRTWHDEKMRIYYDYKAENPRTKDELIAAGFIFP